MIAIIVSLLNTLVVLFLLRRLEKSTYNTFHKVSESHAEIHKHIMRLQNDNAALTKELDETNKDLDALAKVVLKLKDAELDNFNSLKHMAKIVLNLNQSKEVSAKRQKELKKEVTPLSKETKQKLKKGLADAKAGNLVYKGSFAKSKVRKKK